LPGVAFDSGIRVSAINEVVHIQLAYKVHRVAVFQILVIWSGDSLFHMLVYDTETSEDHSRQEIPQLLTQVLG